MLINPAVIAAQVAALEADMKGLRAYGEAMIAKGHWTLAAYAFGKVARMEQHKAYLQGEPCTSR